MKANDRRKKTEDNRTLTSCVWRSGKCCSAITAKPVNERQPTICLINLNVSIAHSSATITPLKLNQIQNACFIATCAPSHKPIPKE